MRTFLYALLLLIAALLGGASALADYYANQALRGLERRAAAYAAITHREAGVSLPADLQVTGAQAALPGGFSISADRLRVRRIDTFYPPERWPPRVEIELAGLNLRLPEPGGDWLPLLQAVGYAEYFLSPKELAALGFARLNGAAQVQLDNAQDRATLLAELRLPGLAEVSLRADLLPISQPPGEPRLRGLELAYTDRGALEKVFAYLSKRRQTAPDTLRQAFAGQVENDLRRLGLKENSALLTGLSKLLRHGEPLRLSITATEPLSPAQVLERLWRL